MQQEEKMPQPTPSRSGQQIMQARSQASRDRAAAEAFQQQQQMAQLNAATQRQQGSMSRDLASAIGQMTGMPGGFGAAGQVQSPLLQGLMSMPRR